MNKPKAIGTAAESAVVRYLAANGWPAAERRALRGHHDAGDITGTPGVVWSVKGGNAARNASDGDIARWLDELDKQRENAQADYEVLVLQRRGVGPGNAGRWWAVMWSDTIAALTAPVIPEDEPTAFPVIVRLVLGDAVSLLRGYGDDAWEVR